MEIVKSLSKGADIDARPEYGNTPLMGASGCGQVATVRCLLDKGADHSRSDEWGRTALYRAASRGHTEIVELVDQRS